MLAQAISLYKPMGIYQGRSIAGRASAAGAGAAVNQVSRMKKKLLIAAGILVVLFAAVVIVVVGMSLGKIIKTGVETVGPKITKTEMKLDSASLSLLGGSGSLNGFTLGNPEGYKTAAAIKAGTVSVGVKPGSLFSDKIVVRHVRVEGPEITFEGTLGTANNLSKILDNVKETSGGTTEQPKADTKTEAPPKGTSPPKSQPSSKSEAPSKKLQVDEFTITGAKVNLSMTMFGGKAVTVPLPPITLKDLGTGPDGITAGELTQKVLGEVTVETLKAAQKAVTDFGKGAADIVTKGTTGAVDKVTKGVGDLFKKK